MILLLILAISRPQSKSTSKRIKTSRGIDIVMVIDISSSMLSKDLKPDRLSALKNVASNFIDDRPNDRIGLVVYAAESYTKTPVTTDKLILKQSLSDINYESLLEDGTAIGMGLSTAVNRLKESTAKSKVIILLTDGVNNSGFIDPRIAAELAAEFEIKTYTIGIGTNGRALAPVSILPNGDFQFRLTKVEIDEDLLRRSIKEIEKLNPRPGGSHNENNKLNSSIVPDFTIKIIDGELKLELNSRNAPELFVSSEYKNMLKGYSESKTKNKNQKDAVIFIKQKLDSAKWFIDAIKQRNQTLIYTMTAILNFQKKYFLSGDESKIKPMILKDIAETINMDISTISRVANSKYVDTPYGIKLIKSFFSEGIKNSKGEEISTIEVKKSLEEIILNEDKKSPYTDDQLTKLLNGKGYPIARRTVAKYREMIGAPVARLRKKL